MEKSKKHFAKVLIPALKWINNHQEHGFIKKGWNKRLHQAYVNKAESELEISIIWIYFDNLMLNEVYVFLSLSPSPNRNRFWKDPHSSQQ